MIHMITHPLQILSLLIILSFGFRAMEPSGAEAGGASSIEAMNMYANLLGAAEDDVCLSIDAGAVFPLTSFEKGHKLGQNKVLARTCTRQLLEIFAWIVQGNTFEGKTRKGVIITGPPGDGKVRELPVSCFCLRVY